MTHEEQRMLLELARDLLTTGQADLLVAELADAPEVWDDADAVASLFGLYGELVVPNSLLDLAVLRHTDARFLLPLPGSSTPPGRVLGPLLEVDGILIGGSSDTPVVVGTDSDDMLVVDGLTEDPVPGFDPALGVVRVTGVKPTADCLPAAVNGGWNLLASRAARALAYELLGVARGTLDVALAHVVSRQQFGRPLAAFQTVQHRLADTRITETGARELLDATGEELGLSVHVDVLKAVAGRAALTAVAAAQQVCGAMGFTQEFGLHRYVRRAYLLDSLFCGCESADSELGALALDGGLPTELVSLAGDRDA
jgi:hypothetical protein